MNNPLSFYRILRRLSSRIVKNYEKGIGPTKVVLLLTTTGRKTGLKRVTPVQYEEIDGLYYIGSARGTQADWYRNIQACPRVEVQLRDRRFDGTAEAVRDPGRIADFFVVRLKRHPVFLGILMRLEGLPVRYTRGDLERFAERKAMVVIRPDDVIGQPG